MSGLPKGWVEATLEELCQFNPKHDPDVDQSLGVNFVPMPAVDDETGAIIDKSVVRPLSEIWKGYTHFADRDVIFAKITPCMENGKIAVARDLANGMACGSTEFHVLRSKGAVEPDFLWRFLRRKNYRQVAEHSMTGAVGQRRVPRQFLETTSLSLPPLNEQKRIVAKLDTLNAKSARARTELSRIETLTSRYKQAVLSKAFSGKLTASQRAIEASSIEIREAILKLTQGWSPKCEKVPASSEEQWAVITTTAIQAFSFEPNENKVLPSDLAPRQHLVIERGDVLLTRAGPRVRCGVCCYVAQTRPNLMLCDKAYRLRLRDWFDAEFFVLLMNSPELLRRIEEIKTGGNDSGLNITQERFTSLKVPLWPHYVQRECVIQIRTAFAKIDRLAAEARRALELVSKLDEATLAKAFRGELIPQDEGDEPAEELLERVRAEHAAAPKAKRGRWGRHDGL